MNNLNLIKIVKNFIEKKDIEIFINYINNNLSKFYIDPRSVNGTRYSYKFGKDAFEGIQVGNNSTMENLQDIRYLIDKYTLSICKTANDQFNNNQELFLSSFWMGRQDPGSIVSYHKDTDNDDNLHFKYSAVLYLNTMPNNTGKLNFPNLLFEYCPEEGDLILFPSHGDEFIHGVDSITAERYTLAFWMTEDKNFILT